LEKYIDQLTDMLFNENENLTYAQARQWVELLWEDFESSYAKAGEYHGGFMANKVVKQFIKQYGRFLHDTETKLTKHIGLNPDAKNNRLH